MGTDHSPAEERVAVVQQDAGRLVAVDLLEPGSAPVPVVGRAGPGDVVVLAPLRDGGALRVRTVLARAGSPRAQLHRLIAAQGLTPLYPPGVLAEARAVADGQATADVGMEDLEEVPFVTIDNQDSRDLDQALCIEADGNGFVVRYAIADASHFVRPGSLLFAEALARGATFYLPGLVLPMLPRVLSEGAISLMAGARRRALVFEMRLDGGGRCRNTRLGRAWIRSRRKLSYARVQRAWEDPWGAGFRGEPFARSLDLLREVGGLRIDDARRRHVVQHRRREVAMIPSHDGEGIEVVARERLEVERCNEQVSLLCNVEGARLLARGRGLDYVQPIFRVHRAPDRGRLEELRETVLALCTVHGVDPDEWAWRGPEEPLASYLDRLPRSARPRLAAAIDRQALLTSHGALFGETPGPHYGVGAPVYARFSAPMREIVGIFTHKETLEMLGGGSAAMPTEADEALRDAVVASANRARALQRTLTKEAYRMVLDRLFQSELTIAEDRRPQRRGTLMGMKHNLVYVVLDDPPLEIKVHFDDLEALTGVRWVADGHGAVANPAPGSPNPGLRTGSAVELRLHGHDPARSRWLFTLQPS